MTASSKLEGLTLTDNWFVARYIKPSPCSTGGTFSHSYLATRGSQEAFVKAFDFSQAFESGADTLNILTDFGRFIRTRTYRSRTLYKTKAQERGASN